MAFKMTMDKDDGYDNTNLDYDDKSGDYVNTRMMIMKMKNRIWMDEYDDDMDKISTWPKCKLLE